MTLRHFGFSSEKTSKSSLLPLTASLKNGCLTHVTNLLLITAYKELRILFTLFQPLLKLAKRYRQC